MKFKSVILLALLFITKAASAQTNELTTWGAWFHTQKFDKHWGLAFDGQFRSANHGEYLRNMLLRPSASYYLDRNKRLDLGYAYIATDGRNATGDKTFRPEHRIFQQFTVNHKLSTNTAVQHRFRLEQRFLGQTATQPHIFAQRLRYFVRGVILLNNDSVFIRGTFVSLQNETFLNVQHKQQINKHVFDQNRFYTSFGYRINKMVDVEAGYLNQFIKQAETYTVNHVMQVALYTRLGL